LEVLFIGGPHDGQVQEIDDSLQAGAVIARSAPTGPSDDRSHGDEEMTEYVLRDGTAQYIGEDQPRSERKKQLRSPV
jgi:hypothetical protein